MSWRTSNGVSARLWKQRSRRYFWPAAPGLGLIFLSVVDTRQLKARQQCERFYMASMRRERRVREAIVAELAVARLRPKQQTMHQ